MTHTTLAIAIGGAAVLCVAVIGFAELLTLIADEDDWSDE